MEIDWKALSLSERETIQRYYENSPMQNCEFTFANNFLWASHYRMRYAVIEGMLVFAMQGEPFSVTFPLGGGDEKRVIDILLAYFAERGLPFCMQLASRGQFERLEELYPGKFEAEFDRDMADYVYESEKLVSLSGKKLHGKRNHINQFKERYPDWRYEPITDENEDECLEMAQKWREDNGCDEDEEKSEEFCVTLNALRLRKELGLRGGLLRAGGRVVAFTLGEPGGGDTFIVHIEKAYADVEGAYPMINQQFIEHEGRAYRYINREEDMGVEGLRKAKLSYHPAILLEKGTAVIKK